MEIGDSINLCCVLRMSDGKGQGGEEEEYWNASVAKGFSWEEGDDTIGMPDLRYTLAEQCVFITQMIDSSIFFLHDHPPSL